MFRSRSSTTIRRTRPARRRPRSVCAQVVGGIGRDAARGVGEVEPERDQVAQRLVHRQRAAGQRAVGAGARRPCTCVTRWRPSMYSPSGMPAAAVESVTQYRQRDGAQRGA